ncbi:MAG: hypothetical protein U1E54_01280 [Candidatus Levybacteria bacterium]|nr:hypothetical protein [Candidatus Levybacteria bacterium]
MKILKPYIIELADTLSGHWYKVWKAVPVPLRDIDEIQKKIPLFKIGMGFSKKGRYLGVFPSSTTILNAYPQSAYLTQWIATQGWNESQRIKSEAGERGTRIHDATDLLEDGMELDRHDYSLEEWFKICSFADFHKSYKPELIAKEFSVFSPKGKYGGRLDRIYKMDGLITLLDIKSGAGIHEHYPLQFASYAKAVEETTDLKIDQTACLQLGAQNKNGYRLVIYPDWKDHYKVFESVRKVWQYDYFDSKKNPKEAPILELPSTLKL